MCSFFRKADNTTAVLGCLVRSISFLREKYPHGNRFLSQRHQIIHGDRIWQMPYYWGSRCAASQCIRDDFGHRARDQCTKPLASHWRKDQFHSQMKKKWTNFILVCMLPDVHWYDVLGLGAGNAFGSSDTTSCMYFPASFRSHWCLQRFQPNPETHSELWNTSLVLFWRWHFLCARAKRSPNVPSLLHCAPVRWLPLPVDSLGDVSPEFVAGVARLLWGRTLTWPSVNCWVVILLSCQSCD